VRASERALIGVPGSSSYRGEEHADRAGPAPGGLGADRRARASGARAQSGTAVQAVRSGSDGGDQRHAKGAGHACAKRYPRSGPCDQDWTEGIRLVRGKRLRAALLLSAAVRSPELRQA
jgi:hypothetical protein